MNGIRISLGVALVAAGLTAPVTAGSAAAPAVMHHPRLPANSGSHAHVRSAGWASSNWSGYARTGGPFTSATATWVVPSVARSRKATFSSSWVGVDGFNDSSLIQTGTEQDYYNNAAHYYAWWEILPAAETVISGLTVRPGDVINASVSQSSPGSWTISLADATTGASFSTVQAYSGPLSSAEWIEEAPTVGGRIATLAHYSSPTRFDPGTANGASPGLQASDGGVMIQGGTQVSTPSNPDSEQDGFNVSYGSGTPGPPGS